MSKITIILTLAFFSVMVGCQNADPSKPVCKPVTAPTYKGHVIVYYYRPACPYSNQVSNYLKENQIPVLWKNVNDKATAKELEKIGGKVRVPCLVVDGKAMYGSRSILEWLKIQAES